jgi:hypothetical protein
MDTIIRSELDSQITQSRYKGKLTGAKPPLRPKHVWAVTDSKPSANDVDNPRGFAPINKAAVPNTYTSAKGGSKRD